MGSIIIIAFIIISSSLIVFLSNSKISIATDSPTSTSTSISDFYNGTIYNLTIDENGSVPELRLKIIRANNWTELNISNSPEPRQRHALATIWGTDKVLLFGGYDGMSTIFDDTWIFDFSENKWSKMNPTTIPDRRFFHAMAAIYGTDKVLLLGGSEGGSPSNDNDTWVFDLSQSNWKKLNTTGTPGPIWQHDLATVYGDDKVVLFGGDIPTSNKNETWVFDLSQNTWTQMFPKISPPWRTTHSMASIYGTDKILVFGGWAATSSRNDTWVYDVSDNNWTEMAFGPVSRMQFDVATIYGTDKVVIFGGAKWFSQWLNDTWIFDYSENNWTQIFPDHEPSPRLSHAMATIYETNKVLLFSGPAMGFPNDTWVFDLLDYADDGTFISQPFEFGPNSTIRFLSWMANVTSNTNLLFQLRSAKTKNDLMSKDFVGSDGTKVAFYSDLPSDVWIGHNNDRWVQYKAYFHTNNIDYETPRLRYVNLTYNYWPNTTLISPTNACFNAENKPTFVWNFTDRDSNYQSAFQVLIDDNPDFQDIEFDSNEQIANISNWEFPVGTSYIELPDGTWFWRVRTKDSDGDWGTYSEPWKFIIDTKKPNSEIVFPENNGMYNRVDTIYGNASDPSPGAELARVIIQIKRLHDNHIWTGSEWAIIDEWLLANGTNNWIYDSSSVTWTSGLWYGVCSRAIDNSDNIEPLKEWNTFIFDTDKPSSDILFPKDGSWLNKLTSIYGIAHDTGGAEVKNVEICISHPSDNSYWSGSSWAINITWLLTSGDKSWSYDTSSIPWSSGNMYIIQSRAIDMASNMEIPNKGHMVIIDNDPPVSRIENPLNESFLNKLDTIVGSVLDPGGAGTASVEISIRHTADNVYWNGISWTFTETWLTVEGTEQWNFDCSDMEWVTDTYYHIRSRATDKVGNKEPPALGVIFMYDDKPPEVSIVINEDEVYTRFSIVDLKLQAEDTGSGAALMAFSVDNALWGPWEPFTSEKTFTLPPMDGEKIVYFRVQDHAGNIAEPAIDSIILDTTPPEKRAIVINDNAEFTKSELVLTTQTASDSLSGINNMAFSFDSKTWTPGEPFNNKKSMNLPPGDGRKTVYLKVNDNAGNTAITSDSIILDTTPPHSLTIIPISTDPESRMFTFSLQALDNLSGVDEMSFSFDGVTWTAWEPFSHERTITLIPANQAKIIYFKVSDKAGNVAFPVSAPISKSETDKPDMDSKFFAQYWFILLVIIILIIIVIIAVIVLKRKNKEVTQEQAEEALTVKPGTIPEAIIPVGELQATSKPEQLPETTTTQPAPQSIVTPTPVPKLAPATPGQVPEAKQIPEKAQVAQLPPVESHEDKTESKEHSV